MVVATWLWTRRSEVRKMAVAGGYSPEHWGPPNLLFNDYRVLSPGKVSGHEGDNERPSLIEVKEQSHTPSPLYACMPGTGNTFIFSVVH